MADEIQLRHDQSGETLYAVIVNADADSADFGEYWDAAAGAWEPLDTADWDDYDIALSESPAGGYRYTGTLPAAMSPGAVTVLIFVRGGAAPDIDDHLAATFGRTWDGAKLRETTKVQELLLAILAGKAAFNAASGEFTVYGRDGATALAVLKPTGGGDRDAPTIN